MKKAPSVFMIIGIVFMGFGLMFISIGIPIGLIDVENGSLLFLYIFGGIGLVFALIGLPFVVIEVKKRKQKARLLETGVQAEGIIQNAVINRQITVNGRHPYKLECQVTDPITGSIYLYSSENIMTNPDYLIGRRVTVYYDRDDPGKYFVDVESAMQDDVFGGAPAVHDYR